MISRIFMSSLFLLVGVTMTKADVMVSDNTTIGLWHMDETITLPSGQTAVIDDDNGTNSFWHRDHVLKLGDDFTWTTNVPTLVPGIITPDSNALSFDGVDDIAVANVTWEGEQLEFDTVGVDLWIKPKSFPDVNHAAIIGAIAWEIRLKDSGRLDFVTWSNEDAGFVPVEVYSEPLDVNEWHHVVAQFKNGIQSLTVDDVNYSAPQSSLRIYTSNVYVGKNPVEGVAYHGLIDEVELTVPGMPGPVGWDAVRVDDFATVALWHFEETRDRGIFGIFTPDDHSNNPSRQVYDGLLLEGWTAASSSNGPVLVPGKPGFGNCFEFDGLNDRILLAWEHQNLGSNDDFRVEAWIKLDDAAAKQNSDLYYSAACQPWKWRMGIVDAADEIWLYQATFWWGTTDGILIATVADDPKGWHHIAAQWHKGQASLYVDGQLRDRAYMMGITDTRTPEGFAIAGSFGGELFWGKIDEMYITPAVPTSPPCGLFGYPEGDVNKDCYVNFYDFAGIAAEWLTTPGK